MVLEMTRIVRSATSLQSGSTMKRLIKFLSTCLLVLPHLTLVQGDITDGNAEHLKREHSLIKPYQGKLVC